MHGARLLLIEEAGFGVLLVQDPTANTRLSVKGVVHKDDKARRMLSVSHMIEAGRIAGAATAPWLVESKRDETLFAGKNDDQIDCLCQFLGWFAEPKQNRGVVRFNLWLPEGRKWKPNRALELQAVNGQSDPEVYVRACRGIPRSGGFRGFGANACLSCHDPGS